jgi:hypothetical protein
MLRVPALIAVALALIAPATAVAADPFGANPSDIQPTQQTTTAPVTTTTSAGSSNLSGGAKTALLVGAGVILFGIAFVIVRDARRSAPDRRRAHAAAAAKAGVPHPAATPPAPGARGRPTGKASAERRRRAKRR